MSICPPVDSELTKSRDATSIKAGSPVHNVEKVFLHFPLKMQSRVLNEMCYQNYPLR